MLLTCPHCDTIFRVSAVDMPVDMGSGGRKVRCSVCGHVWRSRGVSGVVADSVEDVVEDSGRGGGSFGWFFVIVLSFLLLLVLLIGGRHFLVANGGIPQGFYASLGVEVVPSVEHLSVSGLRAEREHDVISISGEVRNGSDWAVLSPFLRIRVSDVGGAILDERFITLASETIGGGAAVAFSAEIILGEALAASAETEIVVVPVAALP